MNDPYHQEGAEPETAGKRVLRMRDDFILLVGAYNASGDFTAALDAQALVIQLNRFEDEHNITDVEWPPRPDPEGDRGDLKWIDGRPR